MSPRASPVTIFLSGHSPLRSLSLAWHLLRGRRVAVTLHSLKALGRLFRGGRLRRRLEVLPLRACDVPGLWYDTQAEALELSDLYWSESRDRETRVLRAYDSWFPGGKPSAFLRWYLAHELFALLLDLHLIRRDVACRAGARLLLPDTRPARWVLHQFKKKHGLEIPVEWTFSADTFAPALHFASWFAKQVLRRGFCLGKVRGRFLLAREACDGIHRTVLRDDILVDGELVRPEDIVFLTKPSEPSRLRAAWEAAERGYTTVDEDILPIPLTGLSELLHFYVLRPLLDWCILLAEGRAYLLQALSYFRREGLVYDLALRLYETRLVLSTRDWGDAPQIMTANRLGARVCHLQWSDNACYRTVPHAFMTHDLYLAWGDVFRDFHRERAVIGRAESVGCIYKAAFRTARERRESLRAEFAPGSGRVVVFFDSSFDDTCEYGEGLFLRYLEAVLLCCKARPQDRILLKPKHPYGYDRSLSPQNKPRFAELWARLSEQANFSYLLGKTRDPEVFIAIADLVVSMGMISPSMIALICGVEALYFDDTGNRHHPLCREYLGRIVMDSPQGLVDRVAEVLAGRDRPQALLGEALLEVLDAHRDERAFARIRDILRSEIQTDGRPRHL